MKKLFFLPAVSALLLTGCVCSTTPENLIVNGSFEKPFDNSDWRHSAEFMDYSGEPSCSTTHHLAQDTEESDPQNHFLHVFGIGPGTLFSTLMPCRPGEEYVFSGRFACKDFTSQYKRPEGGVIHIVFFDENGKITGWKEIMAFSGTSGWQNASAEFTVPENASGMRIYVRFRVIAFGEWKLDDLCLCRK